MLNRKKIRQHHVEASYLTGRFMTEHLVRLYKAFDGDLLAAIVLGTIGQYNLQRYYDEVAEPSKDGLQALIEREEHLPHRRPCNTLSISQSTGIPRETVRRKVRALVDRGWVRRLAPDQLVVTRQPARHFADFDVETLERFHATAVHVNRLVEKRGC